MLVSKRSVHFFSSFYNKVECRGCEGSLFRVLRVRLIDTTLPNHVWPEIVNARLGPACSGVPTATRICRPPVAAADAYWARTKDYWAQVRAAWDEAIRRGGGVSVTEEAESGSVLAPKLMGMADDIAAGKAEVAASVAEARKLIAAAR